MSEIDKLTELFLKFPGIGPRQARRFVYFLERMPESFTQNLSSSLINLKQNVRVCQESYQHFYSANRAQLSPIAQDPNRDRSLLMVVEKDMDLETVERLGVYNGTYFVLGGRITPNTEKPERFVRIKELKDIITQRADEVSEIILATSLTPEGEHTRTYILENLADQSEKHDIEISTLGRGFSTGTELQYSDKETMEYALSNRSGD